MRGKLPIGDDWSAIRVIVLSESNPLKGIADFVENRIDYAAIGPALQSVPSLRCLLAYLSHRLFRLGGGS